MIYSDKPSTLPEWLAYIEALHPNSIEMGLERVSSVADRMVLRPTMCVITVAGTNGKGSTCAMLERVYVQAGFQVGCYTSPHLQKYNERVRINGYPVKDEALCKAFEAVEKARADISLTYFEMGTLAAMWLFMQQPQPLDVVILEVGLGGRLDAVNIFDADCAILTNVDLDHMEYLGDTRDKIGVEKAGVFREHQISICGDPVPPKALLEYVLQHRIDLKRFGLDYHVTLLEQDWRYQDAEGSLTIQPLALRGPFQLQNAGAVIYAIKALRDRLPVSDKHIFETLPTVSLTGRFQCLHRQPDIIADVAHNPQSAYSLAENLKSYQGDHDTKWIAIFGMLADKDIPAVVQALSPHVAIWHIASLDHPRAASAEMLKKMIEDQGVSAPIFSHTSIGQALASAYKKAGKNDKIIVLGSFFTVAAALDACPLLFEVP